MGDIVIQIDIPLGKIAKSLSKVTDEIVLYGKSGSRLYLIAIDPSQSMAIQIDAGISLDEDFKAGLPVKELKETSKGVRYMLDYDRGVWSVTYETTSGLKVRKKINGLEPSLPDLDAIVNMDSKPVNGEALVDYASISQALGEIEGDSAILKFIQGKPGKLLLVTNEPGKEIEVEVPTGEVAKGFEVKINPSLLEGAIEVLEPLTRSFRIGLTEKGILVIEPSISHGETRALIAPLAEE
jgi:hypothetical protein